MPVKYKITQKSSITVENKGYIGETIETKVYRIVNEKTPISDSAPRIYTERKDGVQPGYNIRTDKWEVAIDAMETVAKHHRETREARIVNMDSNKVKNEGKTDGKAES